MKFALVLMVLLLCPIVSAEWINTETSKFDNCIGNMEVSIANTYNNSIKPIDCDKQNDNTWYCDCAKTNGSLTFTRKNMDMSMEVMISYYNNTDRVQQNKFSQSYNAVWKTTVKEVQTVSVDISPILKWFGIVLLVIIAIITPIILWLNKKMNEDDNNGRHNDYP